MTPQGHCFDIALNLFSYLLEVNYSVVNSFKNTNDSSERSNLMAFIMTFTIKNILSQISESLLNSKDFFQQIIN